MSIVLLPFLSIMVTHPGLVIKIAQYLMILVKVSNLMMIINFKFLKKNILMVSNAKKIVKCFYI